MRPPTLEGPCGRAWLLRTPSTGVGTYLVNAPSAHIHWEWYLVSGVHLRDVEGVTPAQKSFPEADHELTIITIDPKGCPSPDPEENSFPLLFPPDLLEQFGGLSDKQAGELVQAAVETILSGEIGPDSDFRKTWKGWVISMARFYKMVN